MNILFFALFLLCTACILVVSPDEFLKVLLSGASSAASLSLALLSSYCVWMGLMKLWEKSGVTRGVSKLLKPAVKKVFMLEHDETVQSVCMNISANFLGLGGVATPYGIDAAKRMQNEKHGGYSSAMLFAVNATNVQLIPTSVIALRVALQSGAPYDILPPVLICSAVALAINMLFTFLIAHRLPKLLRRKKSGVWGRTSGAGARL